MNRLLGIIPFEVGENFQEGFSPVFMPDTHAGLNRFYQIELHESFEEVLGRLDALIGLQQIKKQVRDHANYLQFLKLRKDKGFKEEDNINVHSVFIGNPGTGKTTVAKMMGHLYNKMGLLSKGHVHEVDRVDLVGEYIGQTAPKVKEAIEKARGGVLFIDEAYSLARSREDSKDFGREVIEILVKELSNGKGDLAVIVAGYPKQMNDFLNSNPGLKSRFKVYFEFSDYLPQELSEIAQYMCGEKDVKLTAAARKKVDDIIVEAYRNRDRTFGNARFINDLIDKAKIRLGLRIMAGKNPEESTADDLAIIRLEDINNIQLKPKKELPNIPIDEELLKTALEELNVLIGMPSVKAQIHELVSLVRYYRQSGKDVLNNFFLHTVFIGNPGTGKTTVARILTKIYKALGILERGHMVETDRQGLVAGYVGQTAIKTAEKIDEAMGGVLFIDEAYALTMRSTGAHGDFGDEAVQTLLKRMEDHRGAFFVFVAGYPDNMESFLKANPGLSSRFDKILKFDDYNPDELMDIALFMITELNLEMSSKARERLHEHLETIHEYRDKYFGNARTVRNIVQEIAKNQNLRLASLTEAERKEHNPNLITVVDIANMSVDGKEDPFEKKGIGFRSGSR